MESYNYQIFFIAESYRLYRRADDHGHADEHGHTKEETAPSHSVWSIMAKNSLMCTLDRPS